MEDILKLLIKQIYADYKWLVILFLFLGGATLVGLKVFNLEIVKNYFSKKNKLNLELHPMLQNRLRLNALINQYNNVDRVKKELFTTIMQMTCDDAYDYIIEIKNKHYSHKTDFLADINPLKPIDKTRQRYIDQCKLKYNNGEQLAEYILDVFSTVRNRSLQALSLNLSLLQTESFKTVNQCKYFFFSIGYLTLEQSIIACEIEFGTLNGHIKEIIEKKPLQHVVTV